RNENIMNNISSLFESLNNAILLWTNDLENKVDNLFLDNKQTLKDNVSETEINNLENNVTNLSKLGVNQNRISKIKSKIQKVQQLFNESSNQPYIEQTVQFSDVNLKKALNHVLNQDENADITANQLATIKELNIHNQHISSLQGLEYCVNLEKLQIGTIGGSSENNTISDISPLANLTHLKVLISSNLKIADFSPLKNLPLEYCDEDHENRTYLGIQTVNIDVTNDNLQNIHIKNPFVDLNGESSTLQGQMKDCTYSCENGIITLNYSPDNQDNEHAIFQGYSFSGILSTSGNQPGAMIYGVRQLNIHVHVKSALEIANQKVDKLYKDEKHEALRDNVTEKELRDILKDIQKMAKYCYPGGAYSKQINDLNGNYYKAVNLFLNKKIAQLFANETTSKLAKDVTQEKIDSVRETTNKLLSEETNAEIKIQLLKLIDKAQQLFNASSNQTCIEQTIKIGGQAVAGYSDHSHDSGFARISLEVKDHKVSLIKNSDYQFHWSGWKTSKYASIKLTDPNGQVLYDQAWNGNQSVKGNGYKKMSTFASFDLSEGSTVEVYHAEGPWHRFSTSDNEQLKTKLGKAGYTYTYVMQNNQLVLTNVQ
ncbi:hypothetical protein NXK88_002724, partial [Enterococcus hirae]|nr:hypothetical protein [Enterococcus hirae]